MNTFEVLDLPDKEDYKILLGMDLLPTLGIFLTGLTNPLIPEEANWESLLKKEEEDPLEEAEGFRESLQEEIEINEKIPNTAHCNLEGSELKLPIQDIDVTKIKSAKVNFIPPKFMDQTDQNVQEWLKCDRIYKRKHPTTVQVPLLSTGEYTQAGLLT